MLGIFYVARVQVVIIYGLYMWVMPPHIGNKIGGLHHQVVQRLMRWQPKRRLDGAWDYPPLAEAMAEAGIQEVDTYVARRQKTYTQFISARTIMDMYLVAVWSPGARVLKW